MLRKLYKHEFIGLYRLLLPLYGLLFALAGVVRIFSFFDLENEIVSFTFSIICFLSAFMLFGLMFAGFVLVIINFYKSLLGKQGYLTFSLPFKPIAHIVCKLVCGVVTTITTIIAEVIAIAIMFAGGNSYMSEFVGEIFNGFKDSIVQANQIFGTPKTVLIGAEVVIVALLYICSGFLMFFASMSIGQRFRNKILASIIAYAALYSIVETVMMFFIIIISQFVSIEEILMSIDSAFIMSQWYIGFMLVVYLIQAIPYFIITYHSLTKKLNLE